MQLRRRIEQSKALAWLIAMIIGNYLWLCNKTTRWQIMGRDQLDADLAHGPVLVITWHARSIMGSLHWPDDLAPLASLHDSSPIGRASGRMQKRFGLNPIEMSDKMSNRAASREILRRIKAGMSIALTGDGPLGPVDVVKDAPLEWARVMQCPVYSYAYATKRNRKLETWDRMMLPLPFTRGTAVFEKWDGSVAKDADTAARAVARAQLGELMTTAVTRADESCGA